MMRSKNQPSEPQHAYRTATTRRLDQARATITAGAQRSWQWLKTLPQAVLAALKRTSWLTRIILGTIALVLLAIIVFLANPNWNWARGIVSSIASDRLNRAVSIDGNLRVHLFSFTPSATVGGLKIAEPDWAIRAGQKQSLADVQSLTVQTELMPLFIGRLVLPRLEVTKPNVFLYQDKAGQANWDFSDGKKKGEATKLPPIKNFIIREGQIAFNSVQRGITFNGTVNAQEKAGSGRQAFQLTGDGNLNGKVFELEAAGGPLLNIRTDRPYPLQLKARAGNTYLTAKGQVTRPFNLGQLVGDVEVKGNNLADLYYLTGLTLPNTPAYRMSAKVTRDERLYHINGINGRVGGSDLNGALKVELQKDGRPYLTGDLASRSLDFQDLGAVFGATAANTPQGADVSATPAGASTSRRLLPDAPLDVARFRGMDADVRYKAQSVRATPNLPMRQVSLGVDLKKGLMKLNPIDISFAQGRLQGTATIDARTDRQTNTIDLRLTNARIQDFVPDFRGRLPIEGLLSARVQATGTGNSVHKAAATADGQVAVVMPDGTVRQSLAELMGVNPTKGLFLLLSKSAKETPIRCAVANFRVQNGVLQSQQLVLDTEVVQVTGKGTINLGNERLDLVFKGKPKKFRLTHVNAPIIVGGNLAAPKFGIDAKPVLAQAGLAAVFQTVLPFVNIDYARNANCAALEGSAKAKGAIVK
ncbi:asmA family protein [Asticcacaulis biprosthecium C19]|uniref:AsmA family protein n=1 Tax=Asticcacaulis biprosthecium C19 TaxID=715226 RepID=F4QR25_9CAUL|nr:AsmA family protein [Asticcacaulis biprosthecium]EGF90662.1 asmA family protein [Asticcacaulis biprosthecium C19]